MARGLLAADAPAPVSSRAPVLFQLRGSAAFPAASYRWRKNVLLRCKSTPYHAVWLPFAPCPSLFSIANSIHQNESMLSWRARWYSIFPYAPAASGRVRGVRTPVRSMRERRARWGPTSAFPAGRRWTGGPVRSLSGYPGMRVSRFAVGAGADMWESVPANHSPRSPAALPGARSAR